MAGANQGPGRRVSSESPQKLRWKIAIALTFAITGSIFMLPLLDELGEEWVTCEVISAKSGVAPATVKGRRSSTQVVRVKTTNCGTVSLFTGVTLVNKDEIAASFEKEANYDFRMKWTSLQALQGRMPFSPTAEEYRKTTP